MCPGDVVMVLTFVYAAGGLWSFGSNLSGVSYSFLVRLVALAQSFLQHFRDEEM